MILTKILEATGGIISLSSARKGLIAVMFSLYYFEVYKLHFSNLRTLIKITRFELVLICSCQWQPFHSKRLQVQQCEYLQRREHTYQETTPGRAKMLGQCINQNCGQRKVTLRPIAFWLCV